MILLLGGTIDARNIAKKLSSNKIPFISTAVSEYGKSLALEVSENVEKIMLEKEMFASFLKDKSIDAIIDATHPFAKLISENAIIASDQANVPYFRYERPFGKEEVSEKILYVNDLDSAQRAALEKGDHILLTTGSRGIQNFSELIAKKKVFARVLPDIDSIDACIKAGLSIGQIIAMQGPFSYEHNALIIKEKAIDLLITKDSGLSGGTDKKIAAAIDAAIQIIIIKRPEITYPVVFDDIENLLNKIMEVQDEQTRIRH